MSDKLQLAPTSRDPGERQRQIAKLQGFVELGPSVAAHKGHAGEAAALLASPDAKVRESACAALAELGEAGVPYAGEVLKRFDAQEDLSVRRQALRALGACGGSLVNSKEVSQRLHSELKQAETQAMALHAIAQLGLAPEFAAHVERLSASPLTRVRAAALTALGSMGPEAARHAGLVAQKLGEPALRAEAIQILGQMGEPAVKYIHEVAECLRDSDSGVRELAVEAVKSLGRFAGREQERTVRKALELLDAGDEGLKAAGISVLGFLGEDLAGEHAQRISHFLTRVPPAPRPDPTVEANIPKGEVKVPYSHFDHYMIAVFGLPDKAAQQEEAEPEEWDEQFAAEPEPLPVILRKANCAAALALGRLGKAGHRFAGQLAKLCSSDDPELRLACLEALGDMGSEGQPHAAAVLARLRDEEPAVRASAVASLGRMAQLGAQLDSETVRHMASTLADQDHNVRCAAALALADVGGPEAILASGKVAQLLRRSQEEAVLVGLQVLGSLSSIGAVVISTTINGVDYSYMTSIKNVLESFYWFVKEAISSLAPGAEVQVVCDAVGPTVAAVKVDAIIMQPSSEAATALADSLDGQQVGETVGRTLEQVEEIWRVIRGEVWLGDVAIKAQSTAHVEAVAKLMEDSSPALRIASLTALAAMRGGGPSSAPRFAGRAAARLEDSESDVRAAAALALAEMGQAGAAQASDVARLLQDPFSAVRCAACHALGRMAGTGQQLPSEVLANLEAVAADGGFQSVQDAASEALKLAKG